VCAANLTIRKLAARKELKKKEDGFKATEGHQRPPAFVIKRRAEKEEGWRGKKKDAPYAATRRSYLGMSKQRASEVNTCVGESVTGKRRALDRRGSKTKGGLGS